MLCLLLVRIQIQIILDLYIVGGYIGCSYLCIALILVLEPVEPKCTAIELKAIAEQLRVKYYPPEHKDHLYQVCASSQCLSKEEPFYPCLEECMKTTILNPEVCMPRCLQLSPQCTGCFFDWFRCGITKCPKCANALSNELYIKQDYTDCSVCWRIECSRFAAACEGANLMPPAMCLNPNPYCL